ncbi:MAG: hypothetical protein JNK87_11770 [Bryobacterales bacterium]|nr:hypothetical protein [Bryobacterales bacterium]
MIYAIWLLSIPLFAQRGDAILLSPSTITECQKGLGSTTVSWQNSARQPALVRVNSPLGPVLNNSEPSGSIRTDYSIADGTVFYLTDTSGKVLEAAVARLNCQELSPAVRESFVSNTYFPLQVGNRWVYRNDSRISTGHYLTREVVSAEEISGRTWFSIRTGGSTTLTRYRVAEDGKILRLEAGGEMVVLDPDSAQPVPLAVTNVGAFTDGRFHTYDTLYETKGETFVRGVGLVRQWTAIRAGSNGGFSDGLELVEATVGGVHLPGPAATIAVGIERAKLPVSTRGVSNCAVPCYSPACFVPVADPPGTYKPCTFARLQTRNFPAGDIVVSLRNASGVTVFETKLRAPVDGVTYTRIPFTEPVFRGNEPLPPGRYQLAAILASDEAEAAAATIGIDIE